MGCAVIEKILQHECMWCECKTSILAVASLLESSSMMASDTCAMDMFQESCAPAAQEQVRVKQML